MKEPLGQYSFLMNSHLMAVIFGYFFVNKKLVGIDMPELLDTDLTKFIFALARLYLKNARSTSYNQERTKALNRLIASGLTSGFD